MTKTVTIGDQDVLMAADAFTPVHFFQLFHEDLIKKTESRQTEEAFGTEDYMLYCKLGFILAKRAEHADFAKLTEADFDIWVSQFEFMDMVEASIEIADLYAASKKGTVSPKP